MAYESGFPLFDVEKPMVIPWKSEALLNMEQSGDYVAELKLNEARGFLTVGVDGTIKYYNRHRKWKDLDPQIMKDLQKMNLPKASVFDGGYLVNKTHKLCSLYLFDVLILEGVKVFKPFAERVKLLDKMIKVTKQVWRPVRTADFVMDFSAQLRGVSPLVERAAKLYKVDPTTLNGFVEGFVLKDLKARHSFPSGVKKTSSFFKLRKVDVLGKDKVWILPVEDNEQD
jgi:hypothetical protein